MSNYYTGFTTAQVSDPGFKYGLGTGLSSPPEVNLAITKARNGNVAPLAALVESQGITIDQVPDEFKEKVIQFNAGKGGRRRKSRKTRRRRHGRKTRRSRK
jgi:hypothetical protein